MASQILHVNSHILKLWYCTWTAIYYYYNIARIIIIMATWTIKKLKQFTCSHKNTTNQPYVLETSVNSRRHDGIKLIDDVESATQPRQRHSSELARISQSRSQIDDLLVVSPIPGISQRVIRNYQVTHIPKRWWDHDMPIWIVYLIKVK